MRFVWSGLLLCACSLQSVPNPVPTPDAARLDCGHEIATCVCPPSNTCDIACAEGYCTPNCSGGARCGVVACSDRTACCAQCSTGSRCDYIDCRNVTDCEVDCSGGSSCGVACGGTTCEVDCSGGSACLILRTGGLLPIFTGCGDAGGGGISCAGDPLANTLPVYNVLECPGNMIVCNRQCPRCGDGICDPLAGETCRNCPSDCGAC